MLRDIIRKEIMDNISTLKFVVTFAVVTVLIISGLILGSRGYIEQRESVREQHRLNKELVDGQYDWRMAGGIGVVQTKNAYVLSIIDNGIDNSLGRLSSVNIAERPKLDKSRNLVSPILAVFGDVDLTFIVKIILSLFVILLTYDAVSGEKERGTLKLALANEVPRYKIVVGKILGGFSVIAVSFLLPLLIGLAFMMGFYPQVLADLDVDAWLRLAVVVAAYLLYLAVFFSVGLFVSSLCHRSSTSFIVLLMIWVLFVTIIPRLSLTASEHLSPTESYAKLQSEVNAELSEKQDEMLKEKYSKRIEKLQKQQREDFGKALRSPNSREEMIKVIDKYVPIGRELENEIIEDIVNLRVKIAEEKDEIYDRQQSRQIGAAETLSRMLSPVSAMSFAVQELAGSGWTRQRDYVDQLRSFQKEFTDYIFEERRTVKPKTLADTFEPPDVDAELARIRFDYVEERFSEVAARIIWDIGVLAITALLFFAVSFVAFLLYDIR